jgi:hypothetical protein
MNRILPLAVVLLLVISGCSDKPISEPELPESWEPTTKQVLRAEEIAKLYANEHLRVSKDKLIEMKVKHYGWYKEERKILHLQFYDPVHFPDWENMVGVRGGFPSYFTIEIDISNWDVVDYYASTR